MNDGRVEAAVTCRPPHRAGREQFAHPVPRYPVLLPPGYSDGVDYSRFWQGIDGQDFFELVPYHFSLIVSAIEPISPPFHRLLMYLLKLTIVAPSS
jgi:hypothetical protein